MDIEALEEELRWAIENGADESYISELRDSIKSAWHYEMGDFDQWDDCFYDGPCFY